MSLSRWVLRPSSFECYVPQMVMCPSLSRRVLMFHCLYQTRPTKVLKFSIWLIRVLKSRAVVCSPELLLLQPHPASSILVLDSLFAQPLSMSCLVYLFVWSPLHSPYIFSPSQCVVLNKTENWAVKSWKSSSFPFWSSVIQCDCQCKQCKVRFVVSRLISTGCIGLNSVVSVNVQLKIGVKCWSKIGRDMLWQ